MPIQLLDNNQAVFQRFVGAWSHGDIEDTVSFLDRDAVYTLHISEDALPFAGETVGRDAIEATLRHIRDRFDYLVYRPFNVHADADKVRLQVEFMYRHKASGEILSGRFRLVLTFRDGLIIRGEEYHDRARIEAFMRLVMAEA